MARGKTSWMTPDSMLDVVVFAPFPNVVADWVFRCAGFDARLPTISWMPE
jgi:hypothetical protein